MSVVVKQPEDPILEEKTQTRQERTDFLDFSAFIVGTHVCPGSSGQT